MKTGNVFVLECEREWDRGRRQNTKIYGVTQISLKLKTETKLDHIKPDIRRKTFTADTVAAWPFSESGQCSQNND
jgi:hypothetical protein